MMVDCFIWQLFESLIYKLNTAGSGQREPPRLVLEVRGTSAFKASHGCLQSSRWPDPAVVEIYKLIDTAGGKLGWRINIL